MLEELADVTVLDIPEVYVKSPYAWATVGAEPGRRAILMG
jgi:hypothetical protein